MNKMKKLVSLLLVLVMCASLAACGGGNNTVSNTPSSTPDNTPSSAPSNVDGPTDGQLSALRDAYNEVAVLYNEVAITAEENGWLADETVSDQLEVISITMEVFTPALEGDLSDFEGVNFDELPDALREYLPILEALSEQVAVSYEGTMGVAVDENLRPLAEVYNEAVPLFNNLYEAAEANGWLADEQTAAGFQQTNEMLSYIASGLTDDPSKLEDADIDGLIDLLQQFVTEYEAMAEQVSVPYGDVG